MLGEAAGVEAGAAITLDKRLPVASGLGGGSADAAAALRLLTSLWGLDPAHAERGRAEAWQRCAGLPARAGRRVVTGRATNSAPVALPELAGTPVLLVNPRVALSTADVFARWDGEDRGPLDDWREGRNDLEAPAIALVPQIEAVLAWLGTRPGATFVRMSGSGRDLLRVVRR